MSEFWINFFANLASDTLLAVAIYFIVTQPGEKRKSQEQRVRALGLLKSEAEINSHRATSYIANLTYPHEVKTAIFPMRFTRGAWNALREGGFIAELDDPTLAYDLFRMNEGGLIANKNLRRFELAHLEETGGKISDLGDLARKNCEIYRDMLGLVLNQLQAVATVHAGAQAFSLEGEDVDARKMTRKSPSLATDQLSQNPPSEKMALTTSNGGLWFQENLYPDIAYGFRVSAVLHRETSAFQDILIVDTPALGKVLALDGIVQCAQKDEAIYHETLAHSGVLLCLSLASGKGGLDVLVVGGGDGGIARECLKHRSVARVTVVDIDPCVRAAVLAHFPELPGGAFADPRLVAVDADAADFVHLQRNRFDLILADTPDPVGPARSLFGRDFVAGCHTALKAGGVFVRHGGSLLLQTDEFVKARDDIRAVFGPKHTRAGLLATCTYLGGWFTWLAAVKGMDYPEGSDALRTMRALFDQAALEVRWYSPEMQCASQVLPGWLAEIKPTISRQSDIS